MFVPVAALGLYKRKTLERLMHLAAFNSKWSRKETRKTNLKQATASMRTSRWIYKCTNVHFSIRIGRLRNRVRSKIP